MNINFLKLIALYTILTLSSCNTAYSQLDKLKGSWVTPDNEFLEIRDTINKSDGSNYIGTPKYDLGLRLYQYQDTLSFQKQYYSSATNYEKLYIDRYDLQIIRFNDTNLVVKPVSDFSKSFFNDKKILTFTKQEYLIDKDISFEKIIFHTSYCFGTCSTYHLEITSNRKTKLHAEQVYKKRSSETDKDKIGYFKGQINEKKYAKLINSLQTCNLNTLEFDGQLCCDGSVITIIVYFNRQRKYLKSMFPPVLANNLIEALYDICSEHELQRTDEKFVIEK